MQARGRDLPVAVLFDSSLEESVGQVLALATILALDSRREARLSSLSVSRNSLRIAAFSEVMTRFYRGEQPGTAPGRASVPIGMFDEGAEASAQPMIAAVVDRTGPDGQPLYPREIAKLNDTADPVAVIRNALTAQQDQSAVVVLAGPPVNLLGLLALPEGKALVENKVRTLVVAESGDGFAELFGQWPSPIVLAGHDLDLRYPASAIEADFAWAGSHPLVDAWHAAGVGPDGVAANAAAAVLYAVHPDGGYFGLSEPAAGYRRLTADPEQRDRAIGTIRELVGAPPSEPRRGRGFP